MAGGGGLKRGEVKCFQRQLFRFGSQRGARSLLLVRKCTEAERGMDPDSTPDSLARRSRRPAPLSTPHGLRPHPVRGRGECVRARACVQAGQGEARGVHGAGSRAPRGGNTWLSGGGGCCL